MGRNLGVTTGGERDDRLSDLPDGVLELVLSFLPTEDAARSSVLSRRWRRAWTHAPALNLSDEHLHHRFSCAALAWYGTAAGVPALNVTIGRKPNLGPDTAAWLRDAMERVVGSVSVSVTATTPLDRLALPRRLRATAISLGLSGVFFELDPLALPKPGGGSASFGGLTELSLSSARLQDGGARHLSVFLSSCCPRLRMLQLSNVSGGGLAPWPMVLRMDQLEELEVDGVPDYFSKLQVVSANLRTLAVHSCCHSLVQWDTDTMVQILVPRLHYVSWVGSLPKHLSFVTGCRCVQRLDLHFYSYEFYDIEYQRYNAMQLMEECCVADQLDVCIDIPDGSPGTTPSMVARLNLEQIPRLPNIRVLSFRIVAILRYIYCQIGPSIFFFLRQCPNLTQLHIDLSMLHQPSRSGGHLVLPVEYDPVKNPWRSSERDPWKAWRDQVQLGSLREISLSGFMGTDRETELADRLFGVGAARPALERISVSFPPLCRLPDGSLVYGIDDTPPAFEWIFASIPELRRHMDGIAAKMKAQFPLAGGCWESNPRNEVTWSLLCSFSQPQETQANGP